MPRADTASNIVTRPGGAGGAQPLHVWRRGGRENAIVCVQRRARPDEKLTRINTSRVALASDVPENLSE